MEALFFAAEKVSFLANFLRREHKMPCVFVFVHGAFCDSAKLLSCSLPFNQSFILVTITIEISRYNFIRVSVGMTLHPLTYFSKDGPGYMTFLQQLSLTGTSCSRHV